ncbi:AraC family transcriptional regulator [Rhizobium tubonense]|uniref:AraC family transcriptional regulator n=2 Tax=Rhizobium tubonense TaxID=484088 RepID=A0A2W4C9H5_9HYPH|nr:AraC family transcriptional regulator [Rhizobium tubonense]
MLDNVVITRLTSDHQDGLPGSTIPLANGFSITTQLEDLRLFQIWRGAELAFEGSHGKGSLMIADLREDWECKNLSPFDSVHFTVPLPHLESFARESGRANFEGLTCPCDVVDNVVLGLAQALLPALQNPEKSSKLFLEQIVLALLTHLMQTYGGVYFPTRKKGLLAPWQQRCSTELLATHMESQVSISELAQACELSRSYFVKAFKETFGRTPHRWLLEHRISCAKDLLRTNAPIVEVAISCGFADQSHLTRVFSDFTGVSPGTWRRRHNGRS